MSDILQKIDGPDDLKGLNLPELKSLATEIRGRIIDTVSKTGGHLAANLGVVELTIALIKAFDLPRDKILWDVSHQAYAYKLLTGRRDRFHTLRQTGGISGFLRRDESRYDAFGAGHSGTTLSAALGMAVARDLRGGTEHIVDVVGDGSLGCGISLEALNNVGTTAKRLIVILNDNEMSIAENVGAFSRHLGQLLANPRYNRWKGSIEHAVIKHMSAGIVRTLRRTYYRIEEAIKALFLRSAIFEEFGIRYVGPVDGHDIRALLSALEVAKHWDRPILLHVVTQKGKGYPFAETEPEIWHGTGQFDPATGKALTKKPHPDYSQIFGDVLQKLAASDERIVAITAAMSAGTGLTEFAKRFPNRFFDVGICEEHAVVFAAGLAAEGLRPVVPVYSTFSQRAVDCVIHDVCLQNLPVLLCLDRAGVVGADGPTHHGVFDIALFRSVPNLVIMQPKDEAEFARMIHSALLWRQPTVLRYPRGHGPGTWIPEQLEKLPLGKAETLQEGREVVFWVLGDMIPLALQTAGLLAEHDVEAGIVNARFVRPLDNELLGKYAKSAQAIVTIENGVRSGGFGSLVQEALLEQDFRGHVLRFGWPDEFVPHGSPAELMEQYGLTPAKIARQILQRLPSRARIEDGG